MRPPDRGRPDPGWPDPTAGGGAAPIALEPALAAELGPLLEYLYLPDRGGLTTPSNVVEVSVNGPGTVWVEYAGTGYRPVSNAGIDAIWARDLKAALANISNQDDGAPLLSTSLPGGHRVQMAVGAAHVARTGMAISIRLMRGIVHDWSSFGLTDDRRPVSLEGGDQAARPGGGSPSTAPLPAFDTGETIGTRADLEAVVRNGWPVVFAGKPGSGKTSLMRRVMQVLAALPEQKRVITVEDVEELSPAVDNQVGLLVRDSRHYPDFIKAVLRMNPGVVMCGEIQPDNAYPAFRLLISGSANFITSIHAGSCREAIDAWVANITLGTDGGSAAAAVARPPLVAAIARIVHLDHRRQVTEIARPADLFAEG